MLHHEKRAPFTSRLTHHFALAAASTVIASTASAGVQYSAVNWTVPANIDGLYINVETLAIGSAGSAVAGWDINPYSATSLTWFNATGTGMMRYPTVTLGSAGNLAIGTIVGSTGSFGSGAVVVGAAAGNWNLNSLNRFGFRFTASDGQAHYGWGTFEIPATINGGTRRITEIAWETTPGVAILVGDVGGGSGPYDPCAPANPTLGNATTNVALNTTTAESLVVGGKTCGFTIYDANYFKYTAPATGTYTISTCSSGEDTRMALLNGCDAAATVLACNDNSCGVSSSLTAVLTTGDVCYVAIGGASAKNPLTSPINVTIAPPPIDACVNAAPAVFGDNPFINSGTVAQTVKSDLAGTTTATIQRATWYAFVPGATGAYSFRTCGAVGTGGASADTMVAIGTICPAVGTRFEAIAYNDDAPSCSSGGTGNLASFIDATNNGATGTFAGFPLTEDLVAGQTYYILVGSYSATTNLSGTLVIDGPPQGNPADLDGDGTIGAGDLSILLGAWGTAGPGDLDGDGDVGAADLSSLLAAWGL